MPCAVVQILHLLAIGDLVRTAQGSYKELYCEVQMKLFPSFVDPFFVQRATSG